MDRERHCILNIGRSVKVIRQIHSFLVSAVERVPVNSSTSSVIRMGAAAY